MKPALRLVCGLFMVSSCHPSSRPTAPTATDAPGCVEPTVSPVPAASGPTWPTTLPNYAPLITNVHARAYHSLNGAWHSIIDPYEYGYYDYRYQPNPDHWGLNRKPADKSERIEYDFDASPTLNVPGDWNSQRPELFFYEGTIWYKTSFAHAQPQGHRTFLHFGAANYEAIVYFNGERVGEHVGGFTPFQFEVTNLVRPTDNVLVVKVDNTRRRDGVPTINTDWWNFGGLTRDVGVVDVPATFIRDYLLQLEPGSTDTLAGWVQLDGARGQQTVTLDIEELGVHVQAQTDENGFAPLRVQTRLMLWSDRNPKRYAVRLTSPDDRVDERIGFRTLSTRGADILLNGDPVFLRGISIHEQAPERPGRATDEADARKLLGWAKELGANFVRLAHYPHNEHMVRVADELGLLVWSEVPVYWTIEWENPATFINAQRQLVEMISRDKNRACVALWSVGNETPVSAPRSAFLGKLVETARHLDGSRLLTAALERHYIDDHTQMIDDPLGEALDVVGVNEYIGWYDGLPDKADGIVWKTRYDKPIVISEFGADAKAGLHGDDRTRWSEEFQASVYEHQLAMLSKIEQFRGLSPWILTDFQSPRRTLPGILDYWNRKGLISSAGQRKRAFFVLQQFYQRIAHEDPRKP